MLAGSRLCLMADRRNSGWRPQLLHAGKQLSLPTECSPRDRAALRVSPRSITKTNSSAHSILFTQEKRIGIFVSPYLFICNDEKEPISGSIGIIRGFWKSSERDGDDQPQ